jgi:ABC-type multidrug transport system fused ATPase/permease subunit
MFIAASIIRPVSSLFMIMLSFVDHSRSPRPSVLLNSYLFLTLLPDAAQARTLYLASNDKPEFIYSSIFSAALALKTGTLLLEARQKSRWVNWDEKEHSPEETSGIFSLGVFFWLNKMLLVGYRKIVTMEDLYPLDSSFDARTLHDEFSKHMDYSKLRGDKYGLVKVLMRTLKVPLLLPIPLRLALLGFTFCQPLFVEKLLDTLSQPELDAKVGYGFIGASMLIYLGIAISRGLYWYLNSITQRPQATPLMHVHRYLHHRMRTMVRSILVTETFIKATKARIGTTDDSAAVTLMSTDMERIKRGLRTLHEVWASVIQVALAGWMLYNRLGIVFVAPMGLVIVCFGCLGVLIKLTGDSQRAWMAGVQKRVGLTATAISNMKNLKISGLSDAISDCIQKLRIEELAAGARIREIFITAALLGFIPLLIGPPITFAFTRQTLDVSKVFTSLSFLTLLTVPLSQIFQSTPGLVSALACLGRIQAFLECETRHDFRQVNADTQQQNTVEAGVDTRLYADRNLAETHAIVIQNGQFGWEASKFALRNVNTHVSKSSLTLVVGPVGSGKSTFCQALLGEIPFSEGSVVLSNRFPRVGLCDQTAFLWNGSIRDNIVGFAAFNNERYDEVIKATTLLVDFAILSQGDQTNVGSDGSALSGGQRQRVSLARALYLHSDLLVLDDIFSGLDADTEEKVFRQVFGTNGLLRRRRSTVVLCTHSIRHLPASDYIIALGDGTVVEQGSFDQLMKIEGYVQRLGLEDSPYPDALSERKISKKAVQKWKPQLLRTTTTNNILSLVPDRNASRQLGDITVYKHYFKSMGWLLAVCSLLFAALWGFFTNFPTICESAKSSDK